MRGGDVDESVGVQPYSRHDPVRRPHVEDAEDVIEPGDLNVLEFTDAVDVVAAVQSVVATDL